MKGKSEIWSGFRYNTEKFIQFVELFTRAILPKVFRIYSQTDAGNQIIMTHIYIIEKKMCSNSQNLRLRSETSFDC